MFSFSEINKKKTWFMMEVVCSICHEDVRVPVRFNCFPCRSTSGKPSCNAVLRVCLFCARKYLELDTEQSLRPFERKCLLCSAVCSPRSIHAQQAFEKDYLWMNLDPKIYPCFHSQLGCTFQGKQNELDRHIQNECDFRIEFCVDCLQPFPFRQKDQHCSVCSARTKCPNCSEYVLLTGIHSHLIHKHNLVYCKDCKDLVQIEHLDEHKRVCPCRKHLCSICKKKVDWKRYWAHLRNHFDDIGKDIAVLSNEIQKKNDLLNFILEELLLLEKESS